MPASSKFSLPVLLQRGLSLLGLKLVRVTTNKVRGIDPLLDLQYLLGHKPDPVIFDVGANEGETVQGFLANFPRATVVAFEPFDACYQGLKRMFAGQANVRIENAAVGAAPGRSELNVYSGSNMNSLLELDGNPENVLKDSFTRTGSTSVRVETLDGFCQANGIKHIDVLKVDTQGFDLNVLKGASGLLKEKRIRAVLLEINFVPMYKQQASFQDLHGFLSSSGYRLVDLYNHSREQGYTAWCDACYVAMEPGAGASGRGDESER